MSDINPTWGYKPDGSAKIFDLAAGEGLPDGWQASPACISDPGRATAEALSATAAGRLYELPAFDTVSGFRVNTPDDGAAKGSEGEDLAGALAEIARLQGIIDIGSKENEALVVEIERAEDVLGAAAAEIETLKAALEKALADRADLAAARDEASAAVERLSGELAGARKDLEAATAPKTGAKAR